KNSRSRNLPARHPPADFHREIRARRENSAVKCGGAQKPTFNLLANSEPTLLTVHRKGNSSLWQKAPLFDASGETMMALIEELCPICRSITGSGLRRTLAMLQRYIPLEINEVASGTPVLDWTVPHEWNIRDAYIARLDGTRIVDFAANNLHIVQYSRPV